MPSKSLVLDSPIVKTAVLIKKSDTICDKCKKDIDRKRK